MGKVGGASRKRLSFDEVKATIAFDQPKLNAVRDGRDIIVQGSLLLVEDDDSASPAGPISEFDVKIVIDDRYPKQEPRVFEVGERIPRCADRHINPDGACCVTIWEDWLLRADDTSFAAFMNGPLREFFLGQYWFERTGKWPFGERPHYEDGLVEAFADVLGISQKKKDVIYYLRLLAQPWPKGHWMCPCGSGHILRHCHKDNLNVLHGKVPPNMAKRMLRRLNFSSK